ncbi:hypothetical protein ACE1ET_20550 [Saccharicrinis sp. FJH62]|uniref:hypothetical protein n=1 Tax=Saccharicrinis sp. FJH62 TaxID=3344657 RepID=UPI0035D4E413
MSKKKIDRLIYLGLIVVAISLLMVLRNNRLEEEELYSDFGKETIGTVINRSKGADNTGRQYSLKFEFLVDGVKYIGFQNFQHDRNYYDMAILGMKYTVEYIPNSPQKHSRIFIGQPILSEYSDIENQRQYIKSKYRKGKALRDARPIPPIQEIKIE